MVCDRFVITPHVTHPSNNLFISDKRAPTYRTSIVARCVLGAADERRGQRGGNGRARQVAQRSKPIPSGSKAKAKATLVTTELTQCDLRYTNLFENDEASTVHCCFIREIVSA
ncbi:hypothetical protein EVAR_45095_1 [Eumeta japonica]|uniref:Uncharacterized protein n=1 Tax=Eumeta variegata TaxID=151549 RepID=A0A4C1YF55_EUMVA|nr:hypothetical protein EVAR_45095_1 [Eumeta japonica]